MPVPVFGKNIASGARIEKKKIIRKIVIISDFVKREELLYWKFVDKGVPVPMSRKKKVNTRLFVDESGKN